MKIAMIHVDLPNQSKGGVAFQVHYLANTLVKRGHEVTMFTFSPPYEDCRYQVHQYPMPPSLRRLHSFFLAAQAARTDFSRFDVLHTHGDNYLIRQPHLRTFYGSARDEADSAVTLRRRLYQSVLVRLEQAGAHMAALNVGISEATRLRVPAVTHIVPCGVDLSNFYPGPKSPFPTLLFVGTSGGRKRGQFLADIFTKNVLPRFPNAQLWSVAEKPLVGEGIVNYGKIPLDTLTDLFRRAWVFCLPSTYEGFGVPYIEALASGTAIVASPNPGAREVLVEGRFGILAQDKLLGDKINRLLSSRSLREDFAERGLEQSHQYSWDAVAQTYEGLYDQLRVAPTALPMETWPVDVSR